MSPVPPPPLARCILGFQRLLADRPNEPEILEGGSALLAELVADDDWLPLAYGRPAAQRYAQYLLYRAPAAEFSISSFVWGPGQGTPIHDHTVWGLIGILRGGEVARRFRVAGEAPPIPVGSEQRLGPGSVDAVSPSVGDVHQVANAYGDRVSISIHVYGADIGVTPRSVYPVGGGRKPFISHYANDDSAPPFLMAGGSA